MGSVTSNVHLTMDRDVSLETKLATHPAPRHPWYSVSLTVNTGPAREHEVTYFVSEAQLETFAVGLERIARDIRAAQAAQAVDSAPRAPLSSFAQSLVDAVTESTAEMIERAR